MAYPKQMGFPIHKHFGGHMYSLHFGNVYQSRSNATDAAGGYRRQGYLARLYKKPDRRSRRLWAVYVRS